MKRNLIAKITDFDLTTSLGKNIKKYIVIISSMQQSTIINIIEIRL